MRDPERHITFENPRPKGYIPLRSKSKPKPPKGGTGQVYPKIVYRVIVERVK